MAFLDSPLLSTVMYHICFVCTPQDAYDIHNTALGAEVSAWMLLWQSKVVRASRLTRDAYQG